MFKLFKKSKKAESNCCGIEIIEVNEEKAVSIGSEQESCCSKEEEQSCC